jgi:hypothetical protein
VSPEGHNIVDVSERKERGLGERARTNDGQTLTSCLPPMPLQVIFDGPMVLFGEPEPYDKVIKEIMDIEGVIATGLLLQVAKAVVVVKEGGEPLLLNLK